MKTKLMILTVAVLVVLNLVQLKLNQLQAQSLADWETLQGPFVMEVTMHGTNVIRTINH